MDDLKAMKRSAERIAEKLKELSSCLEEINNLQNKIDAKDGFKATSKNGGSFGIDKEAILNQLDKLKSRLNESGMNVESIGKTKKSLTTNRDDDWKFAIPVFNFVWACKRVDDLRAGRETEKTEVDVRREDFSGWSQVTNNRANQLNTEQSTAMADVQHTMNQLQEMQSRVSAMLTALGNAEQAVVSSR